MVWMFSYLVEEKTKMESQTLNIKQAYFTFLFLNIFHSFYLFCCSSYLKIVEISAKINFIYTANKRFADTMFVVIYARLLALHLLFNGWQ